MASSEVESWFADEVYSRRMFAATAWATALHSLVLLAAVFSLSLIQVRTHSPAVLRIRIHVFLGLLDPDPDR
jgi:hypothetical protein